VKTALSAAAALSKAARCGISIKHGGMADSGVKNNNRVFARSAHGAGIGAWTPALVNLSFCARAVMLANESKQITRRSWHNIACSRRAQRQTLGNIGSKADAAYRA